MSIGKGLKGSIYSLSWKKKLSTTSLTDAEIVRSHDDVPLVIWTRYFFMAQRCQNVM
jgi:hypothetical protein